MDKIFEEFDLAKKKFDENSFNKSWGDLFLAARYLRQSKKYGTKRLKDALIEICKKQDENFILASYSKHINEVVLAAMKSKPMENVISIDIYKEEIEQIKKIKDFKHQVLLLAMLTIAKFRNTNNKNLYIKNKDWDLAIKSSKFTFTKMDFKNLLCDSRNAELTSYNDKYNSIWLKYFIEDGEYAFTVNDFSNVRQAYTNYLGGEIFYCEVCKKEEIKTGKGQKMCKTCSGNKEKNRIR
jgi:hypothetical protein